jgi:hypothetical protein
LGEGQWDIAELRTLLEKVLPEHGVVEDYEVDREFPGVGRRTMRPSCSFEGTYGAHTYGVEMRPLLVAIIQRPPQRTIESIFPNPSTVSPLVAFNVPLGPSKVAVPPTTSRTVQPSMVLGFVSATAVSLGKVLSGWMAVARGAGDLGVCFADNVAPFVDAVACRVMLCDGS